MPTFVGILTFMNRTNLLLNLVEHEKRFIASNRKRHHFEKLTTIVFVFKIEFNIYIYIYIYIYTKISSGKSLSV